MCASPRMLQMQAWFSRFPELWATLLHSWQVHISNISLPCSLHAPFPNTRFCVDKTKLYPVF
jgi:hypothetical protein